MSVHGYNTGILQLSKNSAMDDLNKGITRPKNRQEQAVFAAMQKRCRYPEMKRFSGNPVSSSQLKLLITRQRKSHAGNTLVTQEAGSMQSGGDTPWEKPKDVAPADASPLPLMCCCYPARVRRAEKWVLITCTDTGASIAPDALGHCSQGHGPVAAAPGQRRLQTLVAPAGGDAPPAARPLARAKGTAPPGGRGRAAPPRPGWPPPPPATAPPPPGVPLAANRTCL